MRVDDVSATGAARARLGPRVGRFMFRRLYDGRGKRLQRAIVEQYGKDRLIRSKVDAYVRLFERLLDMMNGSNRGEALVEACLASESGRIYVMLAEAAGRIPPQ